MNNLPASAISGLFGSARGLTLHLWHSGQCDPVTARQAHGEGRLSPTGAHLGLTAVGPPDFAHD